MSGVGGSDSSEVGRADSSEVGGAYNSGVGGVDGSGVGGADSSTVGGADISGVREVIVMEWEGLVVSMLRMNHCTALCKEKIDQVKCYV